MRHLLSPPIALLAVLALPVTAEGAQPCPDAATILKAVDAAGAGRASVETRFDLSFPADLPRRAAEKPGRPIASRDGDRVFGALVADLPVERLWKALNDEDHHAGRLPVVDASRVIGGTPRGERRTLFQYFESIGIGRWWASEIRMNDALYRESEGRLWELWWHDVIDDVDRTREPVRSVAERLRPLESSRGSWLLIPVTGSCTLIEYFNESDPGGALAAAQALGAVPNVRKALTAVVELARDHIDEPHAGARFVRPDGSPMDG